MYIHIISSINCVYNFELVALTVYTTVLWLLIITTHHLSDTRHNVLCSISTLLPLGDCWSYVCIYYYYIINTNFATAVAVSTVTWSAILRQFTKNYDLFQDTTPKCRHYASIAGKPRGPPRPESNLTRDSIPSNLSESRWIFKSQLNLSNLCESLLNLRVLVWILNPVQILRNLQIFGKSKWIFLL